MPFEFMLSIRLMTYMHADYIRRAVEGILIQKTDFKIEVVIGDDFSTDDTLKIAKSFSDTDRIKFKVLDRKKGNDYSQKRKEFGRLYNFSNIMSHCTGKYVAILDGDDFWTDSLKLQKQVECLENDPTLVCCFHGYTTVDEKGVILKETQVQDKRYSRRESLKAHVPTLTAMFRNVIKEFPPIFYNSPHGDKFLWGMLSQVGCFKGLNFIGAAYRIHAGGVYSGHKQRDRLKKSIRTRQLLTRHLGFKSWISLRKNAKPFAWTGLGLSIKEFAVGDFFYFLWILIIPPDGYFIKNLIRKSKSGLRKI